MDNSCARVLYILAVLWLVLITTVTILWTCTPCKDNPLLPIDRVRRVLPLSYPAVTVHDEIPIEMCDDDGDALYMDACDWLPPYATPTAGAAASDPSTVARPMRA